MRQETMKILFFIKKGSLLKNGQAPIVVRVTFNGVSDEARIQRSVEPRLWNQTKGCCKGKDRVCAEINDYIESIRASASSRLVRMTVSPRQSSAMMLRAFGRLLSLSIQKGPRPKTTRRLPRRLPKRLPKRPFKT